MAIAQRVLLCDGAFHQALFCAPYAPFMRLFAAIVVGCHFPWRDSRPLGRRLAPRIETTPHASWCPSFAWPSLTMRWTGSDVANYIWSNTRGDEATFWRLPTGYLGSIWFYLAGPPAQEMMKSHLIIAPCLVTLGFAIAVAEGISPVPGTPSRRRISRTLRCLLP